METKVISAGVVHEIPPDVKKVLSSNSKLLDAWEDITPLARNEWLCWIEFCKTDGTRSKHIERMTNELVEGKRRPCCWPGCPHRTRGKK